ncbi:PHGDH [Branchiostoma lanceolatum]|uniref:Glyoxylate reductase/hydroxypyruvate reductase n=1 Tax=Branchiostoma lanceolatum TaxID=7740 RepID=A0A8K0A7R3_BRALA|nr:PHGDH [Branchiostoma lanceolatum]
MADNSGNDKPFVLASRPDDEKGIPYYGVDILKKHVNVVWYEDFLKDKAKYSELIQGVILWVMAPRVDAALLDALPNVKVISNVGAGVNFLDLDLLSSRGLKVCNTPRILNETTADMGMTLLLASARRLLEGDQMVRDPNIKWQINFCGRQVSGATLGIVGMGGIGYAVAQRAHAFRMNIFYHNRTRRPQAEEEAVGAQYCASLEELLPQCDFVIIMTPLTAETKGMFGKKQFDLMKPSSTIINIARGGIINTAALLEALQNKTIAAAALDVTDPEPLPDDHPLLKLQNVTFTPHLGSATVQTRSNMMSLAVQNLLDALSGKPLVNQVI